MTEIQQAIMDMILAERECQDRKWGIQYHKNPIWLAIAMEELGEVAKAIIQGHEAKENLKEEIVQTAAVLVAWLEMIEEQEN